MSIEALLSAFSSSFHPIGTYEFLNMSISECQQKRNSEIHQRSTRPLLSSLDLAEADQVQFVLCQLLLQTQLIGKNDKLKLEVTKSSSLPGSVTRKKCADISRIQRETWALPFLGLHRALDSWQGGNGTLSSIIQVIIFNEREEIITELLLLSLSSHMLRADTG